MPLWVTRLRIPGAGDDQSQPVQFYDLAIDFGETKYLAAAHLKKLAEMLALLEKLIIQRRSTTGARQKNDQRVNRYPAAAEADKRKGE